jgi:DNA-binding NtrC family response regulator
MTAKLRILVVDDQLMVRRALSRALDEHHVLVADGYAGAERILASEPIDVVVSDYQMPGRDGLDVLKAAARLQPQAHRIMISGDPPRDIASLVARGVVHQFHWKPCGLALIEGIEVLGAAAHPAPAPSQPVVRQAEAGAGSSMARSDPAAA